VRKIALGAALAASLVTASAGTAAPDPQRLVLGRSDVPARFGLVTGLYRSANDAAYQGASTLAQYQSWGFVRGYEVLYRAVADQAIISAADVYRSAGGAAKSFAADTRACRTGPSRQEELGSFTVGDEAVLCISRATAPGQRAEYVLLWRRGAMIAAVDLAATPSALPTAPAIALAKSLARAQDRRMGRGS